MGVVWSAMHVVTRKPVALKLLLPSGDLDWRLVQRFLREARAACAVQHPNIVVIHDVLELDDTTPMMVMELLLGESPGGAASIASPSCRLGNSRGSSCQWFRRSAQRARAGSSTAILSRTTSSSRKRQTGQSSRCSTSASPSSRRLTTTARTLEGSRDPA